MKAIVVTSPGATPVLRADHPEPPCPSAGEVLVEVHASALNPVDASVAAGRFAAVAEQRWPAVLGRDFAGVVRAVGPRVDGFRPGDEVFGYVPPVAAGRVGRGAWAELLLVGPGEAIALRPPALPLHEAGGAGVAGQTALACVDAVAPSAGSTLLVVGATGGVGAAVVQLAAADGARVLAPALPEDEAGLLALGVAAVLDRSLPLAEALAVAGEAPAVDALVDLVSADAAGHAPRAAVVRDGGAIATVLPGAGAATYVEADPSAIGRLAARFAEGAVRVPVASSYALEDAPAGMADLAALHALGKRVVVVR